MPSISKFNRPEQTLDVHNIMSSLVEEVDLFRKHCEQAGIATTKVRMKYGIWSFNFSFLVPTDLELPSLPKHPVSSMEIAFYDEMHSVKVHFKHTQNDLPNFPWMEHRTWELESVSLSTDPTADPEELQRTVDAIINLLDQQVVCHLPVEEQSNQSW